jgi:antitoxin component of MazEF toxin-antitoxin module
MKRKVIKTGNSLAVTIPADFARSLRVEIGDDVEFKLNENSSKMTVSFLKRPKQILLFTDKKTQK